MLPAKKEDEGADWYDREKAELVPLFRLVLTVVKLSWKYEGSFMGGGVVSAELISSSCSSDVADISGDAEDWSLSIVLAVSGGMGSS